MKNDLHGQWHKNALLEQYFSEPDCFRLIDGDHARIFRGALSKRESILNIKPTSVLCKPKDLDAVKRILNADY